MVQIEAIYRDISHTSFVEFYQLVYTFDWLIVVTSHKAEFKRNRYDRQTRIVNTTDRNASAAGGQWSEHEFSDDIDPSKIKEAIEPNGLEWKQISTRGVS